MNILIADDEPAARYGMRKALASLGHTLTEAENGQQALALIQEKSPDLVFLDLNMPVMSGIEVLQALQQGPSLPGEMIIVTANDALETAIQCMRLGASDYLLKPFEIAQLRAIALRNAHRTGLEQRIDHLSAQLDQATAFGSLVGISPAMRTLYRQIQRAGPAPLDIHISGETGSGKELIARELHRLSPRAKGPFITLNCAAIHESLAESTLFGHVKGAFTGADRAHKGVFETAQGGTLFLDEIGDMPMTLQPKLLRTLQERSLQAVGANAEIHLDVRIITASHCDLQKAISQQQFREDLYYRIRGIALHAPPLRQRPEDILLLADYFLDRLAQQSHTPPPRLSADAVQSLLQYPWPGNVRELQQTINAAAAMTENQQITATDLQLPSTTTSPSPNQENSQPYAHLWALPFTQAKAKLLADFEQQAITRALSNNADNISAAARQLGIHRQSLQQKMTQLGLVKGNYPAPK